MSRNKCILIVKTNYVFMPLGIGYVLAILKKNGIEFEFWDMKRPTHPEDYYYQNIQAGKYSVIATGGFVFNFNEFVSLTKKCRSLNSDVPIVLGGNITRNMKPDKIFKYIDVDYIYYGEAEASFVELADCLMKNSDPSQIDGVAYKISTNEIHRTGQKRINLATHNVRPAYEYLDVPYYIEQNIHPRFINLGRGMPMLTGRGCTGGCSFCSPTVGKFIAPSVNNTMNEIEFLNTNYEFEIFHFITEIFFEFPHEVEEFCREYKKLKIQKPWWCCVSPHMSPEVYPFMKEANCVGFNMGLESGSDRILSKTKIGCTTEGFSRNHRIAVENGLFVEASFMVGNENETAEDMRKTFDFLIENKMQQENWGITTPYPGTAIYAKAYKKGRIKDEFAYLQNVLSSRYWKIYNIAEFDFMNISAIEDNDTLYETVISESRRYFSYLRSEFNVKHQVITNENGDNLLIEPADLVASEIIKFSGQCSTCGTFLEHEQTYHLSNGLIEIVKICTKCLTRNFFDFTNIQYFRDHLSSIKKKLSNLNSDEKVIVVGRGKIAEEIIFYDFLGIQLDQIACIVDLISAEEETNGAHETPDVLDEENLSFFAKKRVRRDKIKNFDARYYILTEVVAPWQVPELFELRDLEKLLWMDPNVQELDVQEEFIKYKGPRASHAKYSKISKNDDLSVSSLTDAGFNLNRLITSDIKYLVGNIYSEPSLQDIQLSGKNIDGPSVPIVLAEYPFASCFEDLVVYYTVSEGLSSTKIRRFCPIQS